MHSHLLSEFGAQQILDDLFGDLRGPGNDAAGLKPLCDMDVVEQRKSMIEVIQLSPNFGIPCGTCPVFVPLVTPEAGRTLTLQQIGPDLLSAKSESDDEQHSGKRMRGLTRRRGCRDSIALILKGVPGQQN